MKLLEKVDVSTILLGVSTRRRSQTFLDR